jgi:hypothetical protein
MTTHASHTPGRTSMKEAEGTVPAQRAAQ